MAEVVGLVFGGIPLVIHALDHYDDCAKLLKSYWRYGSTLKQLKANLSLQNMQLRLTFQNLGIPDATLNWTDLERHLQSVYPKEYEDIMTVVAEMENTIRKLLDKLDLDMQGKPRWTGHAPDRAQWEWRRVKSSLGRKAREEVINDLQRSNTALARCFEKQETPGDEFSPIVQKWQARYDEKLCNSVRNHARAVHATLERGWKCLCSRSHQANLHLDLQDTKSTSPFFTVAFSYGERPDLPNSPEHELWHKTRIAMEAATLNSKTISCLCYALRTASKASRDLGVLPDPEDPQERQAKIIFVSPPPPFSVQSTSLKALLNSQQAPGCIQLSRKDRFGIAAAMAWMVLHLSGSPWLDEAWNKEHVRLFLEGGHRPAQLLTTDPYVSCKFRSATARADPVCPPMTDETFQNNQIRNRVLFSLSILLIELCLNQHIEDLQAEGSTGLTSALDTYELAEKQMDMIYREAGDQYGYAVQRCLRCEFRGRDVTKDLEHREFRQHFYHDVVAPIQATFSMFPS
ncbi:MAG: hypothetical protein M1832_001074 [Thelocarpon impressellum]|nr:MAG: hypothetical protein M1832_001074 [Thelocarpon impressellum]